MCVLEAEKSEADKTMEGPCSAKGGTASTCVLEAEESEADKTTGGVHSAKGGMALMCMLEAEESEESEANKTMGGTRSAKGGTAPMCVLEEEEEESDEEDPSDLEKDTGAKSSWGPSWMILHESAESSSSSCSGDSPSAWSVLHSRQKCPPSPLRCGCASPATSHSTLPSPGAQEGQ
jgi:hypothetical protein